MAIIYHAGRRLQGLSTDFQTSGLKAYWKMNEASGNLLNTASAQSSDSTMSADLVSSGTVNRGRTGHISGVDCIGFPTYDADGNKVTANNSASDYGFMNKAGAKFTACWWAKNYSYNNTIDQWGLDGNGNATDISFRSLSSGFTVWFAGTEYTGFTHNVGDANWHFYMLSWDEDGGSNNAQFQLDGVKQTATVTTTNTSNSNSPLTIGDVSGNEPQMDIQEFSLWNRVLTDAEIALIYNSGNGAELQNTTIVGSKPTNVQVGSRLEETDTRKMYHYNPQTPTKDYDMTTDPRTNTFDTSGVTTITHANSTLQINQIDAMPTMGSATYIDLGSALSTKWVMRFRTKQSAYTSYMGNSQFQVGMSSVAPTSTAYNMSSSLNWIGFRWYFGTQFSAPYVGIEPRIQQNSSDNSHSNTNARLYGKPNHVTDTTTSYYHEFIWNVDTFTYNLYDNANYTGTKLATATMSSSSNTHWVTGTPSSISGLQYLVFKEGSDSQGGVWVNQLDDVQIWDGVIVPATGNAWTEEGT